MTPKREIYSVRFNKVRTENDLLVTTYTVGEIFMGRNTKPLLPEKIEYVKPGRDRLLISFKGGLYHEIGVTEDTEIFMRDVEPKTKKKIDNGATTANTVNKASTR